MSEPVGDLPPVRTSSIQQRTTPASASTYSNCAARRLSLSSIPDTSHRHWSSPAAVVFVSSSSCKQQQQLMGQGSLEKQTIVSRYGPPRQTVVLAFLFPLLHFAQPIAIGVVSTANILGSNSSSASRILCSRNDSVVMTRIMPEIKRWGA